MMDELSRLPRGGGRRWAVLAWVFIIMPASGRGALAQEAPAPSPAPLPASSGVDAELLQELRELRREVKEAKADVDRLQNELSTVRA